MSEIIFIDEDTLTPEEWKNLDKGDDSDDGTFLLF